MSTKAIKRPRKKNETQGKKKRKREIISEEELVKAEALLLDVDRQPQSKEDFEKLVFQSPLSSMAWLGYVAFHLQKGEVEAARSVMGRAFKRIPFTEQQEVQNLWYSFVNLEGAYGGTSSLEAVVKQFLQHNDSFPALNHLLQVFERCQKLEDADRIGKTIIQKYKHLPEAWSSYASFLYSTGKVNEARQLLQQSDRHLDKQHQVAANIQFAKLEYRNGAYDFGTMIFEKLVENFPKRTDVWSVYIDAAAKLGDVTQTRELFERVTGLNLPAKKISFIFKKYIDFEMNNGTKELVEAVKRKAVQSIESM